jgi:hypothetical protein
MKCVPRQEGAKGANTLPSSNTSQPTSQSPYRQPGLSLAGGST